MEEWRPVNGYEGLYEVSSLGNVRSVERLVPRWHKCGTYYPQLRKSRFLKLSEKNGYYSGTLYRDGGRRFSLVHRLVAMAFIPNPENLPEINHIDENKLNNRVENLEWCTKEYNCAYGTRTQRVVASIMKRAAKPVQAIKDGKVCFEFKSLSEANRNGYCMKTVSECCNGKRASYKGFKWRFIDTVK